jgi:hypothetical protein
MLVKSELQHTVSATFVRGNILVITLALARVFSLFAELSARGPESPKKKTP